MKDIFSILLMLMMLCSGCNSQTTPPKMSEVQSAIEQVQTESGADIETVEQPDVAPEEQEASEVRENVQVSKPVTESKPSIESPSYQGGSYATMDANQPAFTQAEKAQRTAFEKYSPLDALGRCGIAYALLGKETMPTEERGSIGQVKPSGWHTVRYDNVDGKYLYNRCHLIGYQLSAENANERNLITGTRYLNVEGMLPFENMVADYIKETGNHVLYRVTPVFEGDNLLASGVRMEAFSVEDDGDGICFNVFCHNVQPGIVIDYATGESYAEQAAQSVPASQTPIAPVVAPQSTVQSEVQSSSNQVESTYVLNTNTGKFHYAHCGSVKKMKESNKEYSNQSRDEIVGRGFSPCGNCHP